MRARADADDLRPEYDLGPDDYRRAERGRYADRYAAGTNLVPLDADVAEVFPDADAVNGALRALADIIKARTRTGA